MSIGPMVGKAIPKLSFQTDDLLAKALGAVLPGLIDFPKATNAVSQAVLE